MPGIATNTTDDVGSVVALLWAVVLPVSDLSTILTGLVLIVTKRAVEGGKLSQLVALKFILTFWNRGSLEIHQLNLSRYVHVQTYRLNDVVDKLLRLVNLLFSVCHDQAV
jgi:hypothetical protein